MKNLFIIVVQIFSALTVLAQSKGNITGTVNNNQRQPVAFANAILQRSSDSSLVKGALTDDNGKFSFDDIEAGNYLLVIAQVGYSKYTAPVVHTGSDQLLPAITMGEGVVNLNEASVEGTKPFIEHRVDRTIVNVENSIVNAGSTVLEILKRSPMVGVDNNDNVSLKGKQGVLIMIDGKPTYLSGNDLTNMLKNMRAEELAQIEIITNPSAKYDAAGTSGIINIKLRKKQNLGFNGSFNVSYGQGVYPDFNTGVNLNYRNEHVNVFGSYDYGQNFYFEKNNLVRRFKELDYTSVFDQNAFDKANGDHHNTKAGIDYFINSKHTIGLLVKGNFNSNTDRLISTTEIKNLGVVSDSGYTTINNNTGQWDNYTINLNHQFAIDTLGKELSADVNYGHYANHSKFNFETSHFSQDPSYAPYISIEKNDQPAEIIIKTAKVDYSQPFHKNMKIETGVKGSHVTTDSDVKYYNVIEGKDLLDPGKTNHFNYTENINAAYVNWSGEFGKWGLQGGLRAEQTVAEGKQLTTSQNFKHDYLQFFPSAFISYKLNDNNQFGANYSKRIDRPAYQRLNPFRYFLDPNTFQEGNPNLQPELTNSFELSHTFKNTITTTLNFSHTTDAITEVTKQIDSTRTTYVTTENFDARDNFGISISVPYEITKWWLTSNNINVFNNRFTGTVSGGAVDKRLTSYMINTTNSFKLKHGWSFEISAYYNSKMVWGTFLIDPQYSVSAGISRKFFNERLSAKADINDIFHTEKTTAKVRYNNIDFDFHQLYDSQFVRFHLTYNFGKRTIEQSRRRQLGVEDEQRRVGGGR